jgi:phospholipid/cholesterol/gamma-HCH transport system substrate-binding protein
MPRTRSLAFSELKIGLLAIVAMALVAFVILMLTGTGGFFWQRYHLKTQFADVPGLKEGAPVRVAGVEVGTVKSIEFAGDRVEVGFQLSKRMKSRVTSGSVASLGSLSLLGQATIDITPDATGRPIPEWGYVRSGRAPGQLADVATSASEGLQEATRLLREMREGKGTIGQLFSDQSLYREIDRFVATAATVADALRRGRGTAGRLVTDPAVYESLRASLDSLNGMLRRLEAGEGSLGRLLKDERLASSLAGTTGNLDQLTDKLNRGQGSAGKLLNDAELYNRLSGTAGRLEQLTTRLGEGQGTAGQLLQDRQLYENMNGAASELRSLIAEIKKNPRKYLNVKVSVF